jgi:hypothetical protein
LKPWIKAKAAPHASLELAVYDPVLPRQILLKSTWQKMVKRTRYLIKGQERRQAELKIRIKEKER